MVEPEDMVVPYIQEEQEHLVSLSQIAQLLLHTLSQPTMVDLCISLIHLQQFHQLIAITTICIPGNKEVGFMEIIWEPLV